MHDEPNPTNKQQRSDRSLKDLVFSADANISALFLKALVILNAGALVSILLTIVQSESAEITNTLIGATSWFGIGLTAGLVSVMFYSVKMQLDEEDSKTFKVSKLSFTVFAVGVLLSVSVFLWGVWEILGGLRGALASS